MLHLPLLKQAQSILPTIPAAFSNQKVPGMKLEAVKTVDNRGIVFPYVKSGEFDRRWLTNR